MKSDSRTPKLFQPFYSEKHRAWVQYDLTTGGMDFMNMLIASVRGGSGGLEREAERQRARRDVDRRNRKLTKERILKLIGERNE